jgi:hypothetical protein
MITRVLDPTSIFGTDISDPGPDVGEVAGLTIGLRIDILWPAYDWVADEWTQALRKDGANVEVWRAAGRVGDEGERVNKELAEFLGSVDATIVGLANCGSCTSWTIHDALRAAETGRPTVAVATEQFADLARGLATRAGRSGLRVHTLPYPMHTLPEERVRELAKNHYRPLLRTLGVRD